MIERHEYKKIVWLDVVHPTVEDVRHIFKECKLPADLSGGLLESSPRTDVKFNKSAIKAGFHLPIVKRLDVKRPHEIKIIATKKFLITFRFDDIEAIHRFSNEFEVSSVLKTIKKPDGFHFFLSLLSTIVDALDVKLDYLESRLQEVEEGIFEQDDKLTLTNLSTINRRLTTFNHTLEPQLLMLVQVRKFINSLGEEPLDILDSIDDRFRHNLHRTRTLSEAVEVLQNTNIALISTKQNEVMKIFSIMAFITFPLTLFTSMFGMNTVATPILGHPYDFWIILGIMTFISIGFFGFFKYKKWI